MWGEAPEGARRRRWFRRSTPAVMRRYAGGGVVRRHAWACYTLLGLFALFYGVTFSIFGSVFLVGLLIPLALLAGCVIWLLPATDRAPLHLLDPLLVAFILALLCWPDYLALGLPGLPWITAQRLVATPLALVLLVCLSMAPSFRARLKAILSAAPAIWIPVAAFAAIAGLSIALSANISASLSKFVVAQLYWTVIFFVGAYVFTVPGRVDRFAYLLWGITVFVCLIGVDEARRQGLFWAGHIPWFLKIDDPSVQRNLGGLTRAATGVYRVHSKFGTALGLGEYLALATPFVYQIIISARTRLTRLAAIATVPLILYITIKTDSRLALIGFLGSTLSYVLIWAVLRWRQDRHSLLAPAVVFAFPVFAGLFLAATVFIGRLRAMVWGTGAHQASNDTREAMYQAGIPMVLRNPLGHGIGQGAVTLGYANGEGVLTIDTYYLAVGLEYGVIGFLVYYGLILSGIWHAGQLTLRAREPELLFAAPIAVALLNFFVTKSVFSQQENHPLVFVMLGILVALLWRDREERRRGGLPATT